MIRNLKTITNSIQLMPDYIAYSLQHKAEQGPKNHTGQLFIRETFLPNKFLKKQLTGYSVYDIICGYAQIRRYIGDFCGK